jgi:hypothetical protein
MRIYRGLPGVRDAKVSLCWFHRSKSRKTASNGDDNRNESVIEALDVVGVLEDYGNETYNFDEYDAAMKEFEARLAHEELEKQQAIVKQVFITSKGDGRDQATTDSQAPAAKDPQAAGAQDTPPPLAAAPTEELPVIYGGPRSALPMLSEDRPAQDFITPMDKVMYGSLLTDPITQNTSRTSQILTRRDGIC